VRVAERLQYLAQFPKDAGVEVHADPGEQSPMEQVAHIAALLEDDRVPEALEGLAGLQSSLLMIRAAAAFDHVVNMALRSGREEDRERMLRAGTSLLTEPEAVFLIFREMVEERGLATGEVRLILR
jgi:hypothetical protein